MGKADQRFLAKSRELLSADFLHGNENFSSASYSAEGQGQKDNTFSRNLRIQTDLISHLPQKDKEDLLYKNLGLNPSLSYTLNHFVTKVQIEQSHGKDRWQSFKASPFQGKVFYNSSQAINWDYQLSSSAQKKFLSFFQFLKRFFLIPGHYTLSSQNNFPQATGSASSASSFSALTLAVYKLAKEHSKLKREKLDSIKIQTLAHLSRAGSGSSCRSFFSPWCIWIDHKIYPFECPWPRLLHQFIITELKPKKINSTQAHERVKTSPFFKKREDRASRRMAGLMTALNLKDWKKCWTVCYEEFLDIHSLFESSQPPFKYKTKKTQKVLDRVHNFWKEYEDGPLVTMDAGANVHLLYRPDQQKQRDKMEELLSDFIILSSL